MGSPSARRENQRDVREAPPGWLVIEKRLDGVAAQLGGLRVIVSIAIEEDGHQWMHLSVSREERIPTWADLRSVKEAWFGDREAYMVLPPSSRYVNIHPNVLHLWTRLGAPEGVLPHFEGTVAGKLTI